jgi:hypothetical protein
MYEQLFEKLESDRFSATLNVVSGLKQFVRALSSAVEVQELLASVRSGMDPGVVAERLDQVASRETDPAYENPWDVALAAYLHVLNQVDPKQAPICAERALNCPNCWWSTKLADNILSGHEGSQLEQVPGRPPVSTGA